MQLHGPLKRSLSTGYAPSASVEPESFMAHRVRLGIAAMLAVMLLAGCASGSAPPRASSRLSPSAAPESTPSLAETTPTPSSASAGPFIVDLTWVSEQAGWALSAVECASGLCAELASTVDGGKTWRQLPSPPALIQSGPVDCSKTACISHVRFATRMFGYLYGPALLVTSDGGQTWRPERSLPVEALEPTQGHVYRIVYDHGGCPGPCDRTVEVAPPGSETWRTVLAIPFMEVASRQDSAQLVTQGSQDIYIAIYGDLGAGGGTQQAILFRSLDAGRIWHRFGDPCGGTGTSVNDAVSIAASARGFLVTLCAPRSGDSSLFVVTSSSGGASWGPPHHVPGSFLQVIAAASATHLAVATAPTTGSGLITYTLYVSTDGGAHWSVAVSDPEYLDAAAPGGAFLGFEDSLVGRWVGFEGAIWTTQDGGLLWTRRPFR